MDDRHFHELLREDLSKLQYSLNSAAELFNIIHLNATSDSSTNATGYSDWFRCDNGNSIRSVWVCNGNNNCGDWSDELQCAAEALDKMRHLNDNHMDQLLGEAHQSVAKLLRSIERSDSYSIKTHTISLLQEAMKKCFSI